MLKLNMDLDGIAKEAYETAVKHGWWESGRKADEAMVLIHSEISEALEAYRDNAMELSIRADGKPEGFPSEIADVIIRVGDWMAKHNVRIGNVLGRAEHFAANDCTTGTSDALMPYRQNVFYWLNLMHRQVADASKETHPGQHQYNADHFTRLVVLLETVLEFCLRYNIQIDKAVEIKMAYNKTRPYRHGGKLA